MAEFVHLHLHTEFSLLDGACRIEELLDKCVELKMPAAAITEHGNMFSSRFPIFGRVVYVADPELVKEVFAGDPTVFHAGEANALAVGEVVGVHLRPDILRDGLVDVTRYAPLGRLGYRGDYTAVRETFEMVRPR